jgi:Transglutaminase-like enzymes, putative cysteine proteases
MHLFIDHRTEYRFSEPQRRVIQLLRVIPASFDGQQVIDWQINVGCDARLMPGRDGFGNDTTMLYIDGPVTGLTLAIRGEVLTENRAGIVQGVSELLPAEVFLQHTALSHATSDIARFAEAIATREADRIACLHLLMDEIHDRIRFDAGETYVEREAGEAFAAGSGVCQDHAHIFIAAARTMGIPARYVSGHLYQRDGSGRQPASHAWAEAHVDTLGWIGFDPTNAMCPDDAYIRVAIGLDYRDAAPLSGSRIGGGTESLFVGVTVSQAQTQSQS